MAAIADKAGGAFKIMTNIARTYIKYTKQAIFYIPCYIACYFSKLTVALLAINILRNWNIMNGCMISGENNHEITIEK